MNWTEKIKSYLNVRNLLILVIILISVVVVQFRVFKNDFLIDGGDVCFPLSLSRELYRSLFLWDEGWVTGIFTSRNIGSLFPLLSFLFFFEKIGLPLFVSERILLNLVFIITGLSMYYLIITLCKLQKKHNAYEHLIAFVSSIFYMFNLETLLLWSSPNFRYLSIYTGLPLLLGLFINGINTRKFKYAIIIGLVSLFFASAASNPTLICILMFPILAYFVYHELFYFFQKKYKKIGYAILFLVLTLMAFFTINSWWFLPTMGQIQDAYKKTVEDNIESSLEWVKWKSAKTSLLNIFRLSSYTGWGGKFKGMPSFIYAESFLTNPFLIIISLIFPIIAFSSILFKRDKYTIFFFILTLVSIFFSKGLHDPLESINRWIYVYFPGAWIFRSVEHFIPLVVLGYSCLIGVTVGSLFNIFKKKIYALTITSILIIIILAFPWPFWAGNVVHPGKEAGEPSYGGHIKIPTYYYTAANWVNGQEDEFKILSLPLQGPYAIYRWSDKPIRGYSGADIVPRMFFKPIIDNSYGTSWMQWMVLKTNTLMHHEHPGMNNPSIGKFLGMMNVKYVMLHDDTDYSHYGQTRPSDIRKILEKQNWLSLKKTFQELSFYENSYFQPHIYTTNQFIFINVKIDENATQTDIGKTTTVTAIKELEKEELVPGDVIFFFENQRNEFIKFKKDPILYKPSISVQKINPTRYEVYVENATKPYFLVLCETYDSNWKAFINDKTVDDHFQVNVYANAWYINKTGDYKLILEFMPQKLFYLGVLISIAAFIFSLLFLFRLKR